MALNTAQLQFFAQFVQKELGIIYGPENYFQLEKRLLDIVKQMGFANDEELVRKAEAGITGHFRQLLLDVATNNETSFFRDPKMYKALENYVFPALRETFSTSFLLRMWCAASSFGQEPYSLAILLSEIALKDPSFPRFDLMATDISQAALTRAKEGRYTQLEVQRGLPALLLAKYFTKSDEDIWTLKAEIRANVRFKTQNLLESFDALGTFELIFCRNVLIYQTEEKKREIVERIAGRLSPGGFLILGAAESLHGISDRFDQSVVDGTILFRRR